MNYIKCKNTKASKYIAYLKNPNEKDRMFVFVCKSCVPTFKKYKLKKIDKGEK